MNKQNTLLGMLTAVITALALVASTQPMWLTFVVMIPMVIVAMKIAIAITNINEQEEKKARMEELDNLIQENTEAFHAVARYECRGSAWEAILNAERHALFTEKWALEDANA